MRTDGVCDECTSRYFLDSSRMTSLCPSCAHWLYGYEPCSHDGLPCGNCGWDGSRSRHVLRMAGIESRDPSTPAEVLDLLAELGATPWLLRHHELVLEAATDVCALLTRDLATLEFDSQPILLGASLHDAGKIVATSEMHGPGHAHERLGRLLLGKAAVPAELTRFCVTHARWHEPWCGLEDRLVALADKLWKGKREEALEKQVLDDLAAATAQQVWEVFGVLDALCEQIATRGPERLQRSVV